MDFKMIPSLMGKYEINAAGVVRNAKTKHVMQEQRGQTWVYFKGRLTSRSVKRLMNEVFGNEYKLNGYCAVTIRKGAEVHHFTTMKACAIFLSPLVYLGVDSLRHFLTWRRKRIGLWEIEYC